MIGDLEKFGKDISEELNQYNTAHMGENLRVAFEVLRQELSECRKNLVDAKLDHWKISLKDDKMFE